MAASMKMLDLLAWICLPLVLFVPETAGKSKFVSVNMNAKWPSTPMMLEASEFLAKDSSEDFWGFVTNVASVKPELLAEETDKDVYQMILQFASKYVTPMIQNLLKLSLSLRAFSPVVQMYQQIAEEDGSPGQCPAFVNIHGQKSCDPGQVRSLIASVSDRPAPPVYDFDHIYPGDKSAPVTVILYGQLGTSGFLNFHTVLRDLSSKKEIVYILRHYVQNPSKHRTRLSGYGVELAIKSTEYKAKDDTKVEGTGAEGEEEEEGDEDDVNGFIFSKLRELHPELKADLKQFRTHLTDSSSELESLKVWQFQDLSLQAAQRVMSASQEDAMRVLRDISQNFPTQTRSLVKTHIDDEMKKEIEKNQQYFENYLSLEPGDSAFYLNGISMDMEVYDIFTMMDRMRDEAKLMEGLFSLGFKGSRMNQLLKVDLSGGNENFAIDIRHTAVQFINDLEKDEKYKGWPNMAKDILQPTFPGMLRHVAKNFFHLVFIVDPINKDSRELLKMAEAFYVHSVPVRIGFVFVVNSDPDVTGKDDAGVALTNAFDYIRQEISPSKGLSFITDVYEKVKSDEITAQNVIAEFLSQHPDEDVDKVFGKGTEYDFIKRSGADFVKQSGLSDFPQVLMNGVPMKKKHLNQDNFEEGVVSEMLSATPEIQQAVYQGRLHDGHQTLEWLMQRENVLPRLNSKVLSPPSKILDLTENMDGASYDDPDIFQLLTSTEMTAIMADRLQYLTRGESENLHGVTMWIVCDLETPHGRDLLYNALKRLKHSHDLRIGVVFNAISQKLGTFSINKAVYAALESLDNQNARNFITKLIKEENVIELQAGTKTLEDLAVHGMDIERYKYTLNKLSGDFLKVHRAFVEHALGFDAGARCIITNGGVLGPLGDTEEFLSEDVDLLEIYVQQRSAKKVKSELNGMDFSGKSGSDLVMKVANLLTSSTSSDQKRRMVEFGGDLHSVLKIPGDPNRPAFQVEAILDPVSSAAQKISAVLMALKEVANLDIKIFMNCRSKLSEMPLKTFYRYVMEPELGFRVDGTLTAGPTAKFQDLPQKSLLTLGMNLPESWLAEAVKSPHDLDNILLEEVESGVHADFDLEYLLLEGHCHETNTGQPPRGLQLTLRTNSTHSVMDTIVMANLGYFQLKANPGAWMLSLREGRSANLYEIVSHEFTDSPKGSKDVVVAINSFKSKIVRLKVNKLPGKENIKLLDDEDEVDKSLWDSISSTVMGEKKEEEKDQTLNIFSVASGHLYERLLRIMMMSVLKNTKSKVKFWFLKNYLSPTFKAFIPHYAKEYGFEYELVQYKWPRWLNQQKEKQRIIWGYKILFLDVLFPLDVKKVIFVDADQIVRTDLQELYDFDLGGAPYGYTPFCDSRTEMDGFRFWKTGYWANHLAGRRYHISALYVIDLKRFRRIAAGDRLRGQYQGLSQDPNSLSNLDQDLPNNMIHQVTIKSLPQDWLWCETWCSDESKAKAKTIDLCNNPMTKEPKLNAAMRIVPEWKEYDYEIKVFWDSIYGTNTRSQIEYDPPELSKEKK
ncbi:hypothetical protein ACJMK2_017920, partial [Sinanodonta woodiana]